MTKLQEAELNLLKQAGFKVPKEVVNFIKSQVKVDPATHTAVGAAVGAAVGGATDGVQGALIGGALGAAGGYGGNRYLKQVANAKKIEALHKVKKAVGYTAGAGALAGLGLAAQGVRGVVKATKKIDADFNTKKYLQYLVSSIKNPGNIRTRGDILKQHYNDLANFSKKQTVEDINEVKNLFSKVKGSVGNKVDVVSQKVKETSKDVFNKFKKQKTGA